MTTYADQFLKIIDAATPESIQESTWYRSIIPDTTTHISSPYQLTHPRRYALIQLLCNIAKSLYPILQEDPILLRMNGECLVFGNVYQSWTRFRETLDTIKDLDDPNGRIYLFTGNWSQRHPHIIAMMWTLMSLKIKYPRRIYLLKGNQEHRLVYAMPLDGPTLFEELVVMLNLENPMSWETAKCEIHDLKFNEESKDRYYEVIGYLDILTRSVFTEVSKCMIELPLVVIVNDDIWISHAGFFERRYLENKNISTRVEMIEKYMTKTGDTRMENKGFIPDFCNAYRQILVNHPFLENDPYHQDLYSKKGPDSSGWMDSTFYRPSLCRLWTQKALDEFLTETGLRLVIRYDLQPFQERIPDDGKLMICHRPILIQQDGSVNFI